MNVIPVMLNTCLQTLITAIMHVWSGKLDVAQGRDFEQPFVLDPASHAAQAFVDIGIFQAVIVDGWAGHEIIGAMAGGASGIADLAEENLAPEIFLWGKVGETEGYGLVVF